MSSFWIIVIYHPPPFAPEYETRDIEINETFSLILLPRPRFKPAHCKIYIASLATWFLLTANNLDGSIIQRRCSRSAFLVSVFSKKPSRHIANHGYAYFLSVRLYSQDHFSFYNQPRVKYSEIPLWINCCWMFEFESTSFSISCWYIMIWRATEHSFIDLITDTKSSSWCKEVATTLLYGSLQPAHGKSLGRIDGYILRRGAGTNLAVRGVDIQSKYGRFGVRYVS